MRGYPSCFEDSKMKSSSRRGASSSPGFGWGRHSQTSMATEKMSSARVMLMGGVVLAISGFFLSD